MMLRRFHPLLLFFLLVGAAAALFALSRRYEVEARTRTVGLVLDYGQLRNLIGATGVPADTAYREFRNASMTGVAVTEEILAELQSEGALTVRLFPGPAGREYRVEISDPAVAGRVAEYVSRFLQGATESRPNGDFVSLPGLGGGRVYVPGRWDEIRGVPIGLDPEAVKRVQSAGFEVIGRVYNPLGLTPDSLRWRLNRLKELGVTTVVFAGEEVLGYRGLVEETARAFRELGLLYGSVEFGKQRGDEALAAKLVDRLVRVHSVSPAEIPRLTVNELVERYVRAASERNIRLSYVRLPVTVSSATFQDTVDYARALSKETAEAGFGLGSPLPFSPVWTNPLTGRLVPALIALGVGAAVVLLLAAVVPLKRGAQAGWGLAAALICALLALSGITLGLQAVALLGAVVFPTLGFALLPQPVAAFEDHEHAAVRDRGEAVVPAVAEFAAISLVTLVGALMVAGMLSHLPFLVKTKSFVGIKAATALPLLGVLWIYMTGMSGQYPSITAERDAVRGRLGRFFAEPLRIWHVVALGAGLAALLLLLARSGNDPGVGVSPLELRFRALLDRVLLVRPRTKEFLIGHPALILALAMATLPRWRRWAFPLLLVGIIGQVGMLNSFCHLHSPLRLTLLRTFHGLWMGLLLGLALVWVWNRVQGWRVPREESLRI